MIVEGVQNDSHFPKRTTMINHRIVCIQRANTGTARKIPNGAAPLSRGESLLSKAYPPRNTFIFGKHLFRARGRGPEKLSVVRSDMSFVLVPCFRDLQRSSLASELGFYPSGLRGRRKSRLEIR